MQAEISTQGKDACGVAGGVGAAMRVVCLIHQCQISTTLSLNFAWFFNLLIESFYREAGT